MPSPASPLPSAAGSLRLRWDYLGSRPLLVLRDHGTSGAFFEIRTVAGATPIASRYAARLTPKRSPRTVTLHTWTGPLLLTPPGARLTAELLP